MVHVAAWRNRHLCVALATYFLWLLLPAFSSPVQRRHGFLSIVVALRPYEAKAEEPFNPLKLKGYFWETGKFYEGETSEANIAEILDELKETESLLWLETALRTFYYLMICSGLLDLFKKHVFCAWFCSVNRIQLRQPFESLVSEGKFEELKTKLRGANFSESLLRIRGKRVLWFALWIWDNFFRRKDLESVHFEYTVVALCFFLHQSLPFLAMPMQSIHTHNIIYNIIIRTYTSIYIFI